MSNPAEVIKLLVQWSVFGLVITLWVGGVVIWYLLRSRRSQQIHERLGLADDEQHGQRVLRLWHDGELVETTVRGEAHRSLHDRLEQLRESAGWTIPMGPVLVGLAAAIACICLLLLAVTGNYLLPGVVAILMVLGFRMVLQACINRRTQMFEKQLVDALDLGSRSLRAGHPLSGAFQLISEEIPEPVGQVFAEICEQEALGVSVQKSLERVAAESHSPDLKMFAASVVIQLRAGGNLAEMMERVAWVVRDRMRLGRRARVLTAEAQLSKWVLLSLPLGLFLGLNVLNPQYMEPLYVTSLGQILLAAGAVGLLTGSWIMSRMARLSY